MKTFLTLLSVLMLLVGLPLLHGFLVILSIEKLASNSTAMSFFYLFTIPAWTLVIMVFVIETYRRSFIRSRSRISGTLMLGLFGMIAPAVGLALSPVAADIGLVTFAGVAALGLFVGLFGAVLFKCSTGWIKKMGNS
ncbi:MAG: hypothetical protein ACYST9_05880 [Planctomycetota bacterium]|jgi:hypothetical protein